MAAQTKNDRTHPFTGAVNWTAISGELHSVELHTDKSLYGFYLKEVPQAGTLVVLDVSTGAATGAGLTVVGSGTPGAGQCRPDTDGNTGFVWCNSADNGKSLSVSYNGGGFVANQKNIEDIVAAVGAGVTDAELAAAQATFHVARDAGDTEHDLLITRTLPDGTTSTITKRMDATFAKGTGNGGMQSGSSLPTSGYYWLFVITEDSTGDWDIIGHTSLSPTIPSGLTRAKAKPILGWLTDASANNRALSHNVNGNYVLCTDTLVLDVDVTNQGTSRTTRTAVNAIPNVMAFGDWYVENGSAAQVKIEATAHTDQAPLINAAALSIGYVDASDPRHMGYLEIPLDEARQFATDSSAVNTTIRIQIKGWKCNP